MCDECTWHHKTFLVRVHRHLAINVFCFLLDNTGDNFLLFTSGGLLNRMSMQTYSYTVIPIPNANPNPIAIVFNPDNHRVYFTEVMLSPGSQIYSADLDGNHPVLIKQLPQSQYSVPEGCVVQCTWGSCCTVCLGVVLYSVLGGRVVQCA